MNNDQPTVVDLGSADTGRAAVLWSSLAIGESSNPIISAEQSTPSRDTPSTSVDNCATRLGGEPVALVTGSDDLEETDYWYRRILHRRS